MTQGGRNAATRSFRLSQGILSFLTDRKWHYSTEVMAEARIYITAERAVRRAENLIKKGKHKSAPDIVAKIDIGMKKIIVDRINQLRRQGHVKVKGYWPDTMTIITEHGISEHGKYIARKDNRE